MRYWGTHGGYLIIDHSASPGVSEEYVRSLGRPDMPYSAEGKIFEADTYNCAHCGFVVVKNPMRQRPRNKCHKCDRVVCDKPECNAGCLPLARVFDVAEAQAHKGVSDDGVRQAITQLRRSVLGHD